MSKIKFAFLCVAMLPFVAFGQQSDADALKVLDRAASAYGKAGGVLVGFEVNTENMRTKELNHFDGEIKMKGPKSYLKTDEAEVWYDGKNQWSYYKDGEVNLSVPTLNEMEVYNPSILFKTYKKLFICTYVGQKRIGGEPLEVVELRPIDGNTNVIKITCRFDQAFRLSSVEVSNKNMTELKLKITKYTTGQSFPDATFVFNPADYPGVEVVDLR